VDRLTVPEAARRLGVTPDAVRKRIKRDNIRWEKDDEGRVYVYLDEATTDADTLRDQSATERLFKEMQSQIEHLRDQLDKEREANRENRRLLALQLEHMRALEPPRDTSSDERESPETPFEKAAKGEPPPGDTEQPRPPERSWWQRWFGPR